MLQDDTQTSSFSTEDSLDQEVNKTKNKKPVRKRPALKKLNKREFRKKVDFSEPQSVITKLKVNAGNKKTVQSPKGTKKRNTKETQKQSTPIGVFTKTILEALYELNENQKWQTK